MGNRVTAGYAVYGGKTVVVDGVKLLSDPSLFTGMESKIRRGITNGIDRLIVLAYIKMANLTSEVNVPDGYTNRIKIKRTRNGLRILAPDYAIYVELGTGYAGLNSPHPNPTLFVPSWSYMSGEQSRKVRWIYPTRPNDPNPSKFKSKNGEWYAITKQGQPSRPLIYKLIQYIQHSYGRVMTTSIQRELRKP